MHRLTRFIAGSLFVLAVCSASMYAHAATKEQIQAQINENNAQIQQLRDEIAKLQNTLAQTTEQKQTLQNAINALNLNIKKLQKSISLSQAEIKQKDGEISTISGNIDDTTGRIHASQGEIADSLRQLDTADDKPLFISMLSGETLSAVFDEAASLSAVRTSLQTHIAELSGLKDSLQTSKSAAEQKRQELAALNDSLSQQKKGLDITKSEQSKLLDETKSKESAYQALIAQKKAEEASFEQALVDLASQLQSVSAGSILTPTHSTLHWPLDSVSITQYFGNTAFSQSGAYSGKGHNGIDFRAAIGTPVHAALSGVVQEINEGAVKYCQYGKWVLVKHGNGLTSLYAHLSSISVSKGQQVTTGQLLGYSGDTGYATGPHLHLTVYASSGVTFKNYTCNSGYTVYIPIAPLNAYLDPLSYLPSL